MSREKSSPAEKAGVYYLSYHPALIEILGSERAAILFNRLEYWFKIKPDGFYKFLEPCQHRLYREEDSWCSELGISRPTLNKAFDLIGERYGSKSAFSCAHDPFKGKFYASYYNRQNHLTHFVRNDDAVIALFVQLATVSAQHKTITPTSAVAERSKTHSNASLEIKQEPTDANCESLIFHENPGNENNFRSCNENIFRSSTENFSLQTERNFRSCNERFFRSIYKQNIPTKVTSLPLENVKVNFAKKEFSVSDKNEAEKMEKIWIEEIGELENNHNQPGLLQKLLQTLKMSFDGELQSWGRYCRLIASSKFLMGETDNDSFKKIWLAWAIKPQTIQRILAGEFTFGDRPTRLDIEYQKQLERVKDLNDERDLICTRISRVQEDVQKQIAHKLKAAIDKLSTDELERYRKEFETKLQQGSDAASQEFQEKGWNGCLIETLYHFFLRDQLSKQIFGDVFEKTVALKIQQHPDSQSLVQERASLETSIKKEQAILQNLVNERQLTIAMLTGHGNLREDDIYTPTDRNLRKTVSNGQLALIADSVQAIVSKRN